MDQKLRSDAKSTMPGPDRAASDELFLGRTTPQHILGSHRMPSARSPEKTRAAVFQKQKTRVPFHLARISGLHVMYPQRPKLQALFTAPCLAALVSWQRLPGGPGLLGLLHNSSYVPVLM